jgi:hypothetical protein
VLGHLAAEDGHPAAVRLDQAEQRPQGGGLARPVGPEEAVHLALLHDHVEAVERAADALAAPVGLLQTGYLEYGSH